MQKILTPMWPYNFLHFSQQYTVHIMARREKNRAEFSHVRVWGLCQTNFSTSNICLYIIAAALRKQTGQAWRLEFTTGIFCLGWTQTWLKSAQMARHGYDTICAHNLFAVYHIDKLSTDNRTLFDDEKMCECTQIFHVKMWWMCEYSYGKNVNGGDFDTNMSIDMCMKVMLLSIDIKLRTVYKYIYLYHAYCYLHHLCAWWCRCICIWICKCICKW